MGTKINLFELGMKLSRKKDLSNINSMLIFEPEESNKEYITSDYFESNSNENDNSNFNLGIKYNVYSRKNSKKNVKDFCQVYKLKGNEQVFELIKICLSSIKPGQITVLIVIDLSKLENLIQSLVEFVDELRRILKEIIEKKPNLIQNSNYMEMISRFEDDNKSVSNFKAFPVPLMIIGCNFGKFSSLNERDRQIVQRFLRHFCLINFGQLYLLNEQSEYSIHRCKLLVNHLAFERNLKEISLKFNQMDKSLLIIFGQDKLENIYTKDRPLGWNEILQLFKTKFEKKQESKGPEKIKIDLFLEPDIDYIYKFNLEKLEFSRLHGK